jgi:hypothetical protein
MHSNAPRVGEIEAGAERMIMPIDECRKTGNPEPHRIDRILQNTLSNAHF